MNDALSRGTPVHRAQCTAANKTSAMKGSRALRSHCCIFSADLRPWIAQKYNWYVHLRLAQLSAMLLLINYIIKNHMSRLHVPLILTCVLKLYFLHFSFCCLDQQHTTIKFFVFLFDLSESLVMSWLTDSSSVSQSFLCVLCVKESLYSINKIFCRGEFL